MLQTKVIEKIKIHFVFINFFFENLVVYEQTWKYIEERCRPQIICGTCALHAGAVVFRGQSCGGERYTSRYEQKSAHGKGGRGTNGYTRV
jgi:hypothetical protein